MWSNELLANERRKRRRLAAELDDRGSPELFADDRRSFGCDSFERRQLPEARCEQRLDRRWDLQLLVRPVDGDQREHLLDEERVPLGRRRDPPAQDVGDAGAGEQVVHQLLGLLF